MTILYEAAGYALSAENDVAILASGERRQRIPLRHGADEIPAGLAAALRKAGQDPADYFCVAGSHVLRRAALAAWTAGAGFSWAVSDAGELGLCPADDA